MRLTAKVKRYIVSNALKKAGVIDAKSALAERRAQLAEDVRIDAWGGESGYSAMQKLSGEINKLISQLPERCKANGYTVGYMTDEIPATFGGLCVWLPYSNTNDPVKRLTCCGRHMLPADHELSAEFTKINNEQENVDSLANKITTQVMAKCNEATTVKGLLKLWPEVAELLPEDQPSACTALTIQTKELNELLGLGG